jgi:stearoyl-CoA desaturase (delta-9 desaturase)
LFQNNHHYDKENANFARKWFEFDMTYIIMLGLNKIRVIHLIPAVAINKSIALHSNERIVMKYEKVSAK